MNLIAPPELFEHKLLFGPVAVDIGRGPNDVRGQKNDQILLYRLRSLGFKQVSKDGDRA